MAAPIYIPTNCVGWFPFLHTLFCIVWIFFKDGHSNQCGWQLTAGLICISLIISGSQGEFRDSQSHAMVTGVIPIWLILGEECDVVVVLSCSLVSIFFPPRGL